MLTGPGGRRAQFSVLTLIFLFVYIFCWLVFRRKREKRFYVIVLAKG